MLDTTAIRAQFPILGREVHGRRLVYLDNAATTQKPRAVIQAIVDYYEQSNANVHRGIHTLAEEATGIYEGARARVARFIGARHADEVVFTRGTTEAINLVASSWGRANLGPGDTVLVTEMEHHSNIVPWQLIVAERGASLAAVPLLPDGTLDLDAAARLLRERSVKLFAVTHVSNVLGTINPVADLATMAHDAGALFLVDGAQSAPHLPVDVQAIGADFYACSAHKMYGPTGIGALWGRAELLARMEPYQGGGSMIGRVRWERSTWADAPARFEAGTPNIEGAAGFGAAVDFLQGVGMAAVRSHEVELNAYALDRLAALGGVTVYGPLAPKARSGVAAFSFRDLHPHDVAQALDSLGVAVRAGHHCTQPLHACLDIAAGATNRASFGIYNDRDDVDALVEALAETGRFFGAPEPVAAGVVEEGRV